MMLPDDSRQVSQPLSRVDMLLVAAALELEKALGHVELAMRLKPELADPLFYEPLRIRACMESLRQEMR